MNEQLQYKWLNSHSRIFLERGYLKQDQTPEQRYREIAETAEKYLGIVGFADKFEDYLSRGFYSLATPVITNYGNERGLPVSCFNSHIADRTADIFEKVGEVGIMSKNGGGTSGYFGDLRPRGSLIKNGEGGVSDGAVRFMELFDKTADVISQGSSRRGSFAAYLPVEHPDIEEFLHIRSEGHVIQNMSIGITITNKWMQEMRDGDKDKRKIWGKIIKKRFETGYPYIFFTDNVNNHAPQVYKDKGLKINASNLCVAGNTRILTKDGYKIISNICDKFVEIWNGKEWSKVQIMKTGENAHLIDVRIICTTKKHGKIFSSDFVKNISVTPYHKFYDIHGEEIQASNLSIGQRLQNCTMPDDMEYNYTVFSINDEQRYGDTYCVNEPLQHKAVFNEILTGNCSEILLSSDDKNSFVCVLSSLNLLHWDEIVQTDAIETLIYFLDTVNEEFVRKTEGVRFMETAHHFAKTQRALGAGVLGWHSLLQSKMIAFESMEAKLLNASIWKIIRERADNASIELAKMFGEPELLQGYGRRNVTCLAVAPTTSSSFILGQVSPSIEPQNSNYYVKKLAKGNFTYKNPYLKELLKKYQQNDSTTWDSILIHGGSVQHLDFLSQEEKNVFKTFGEISQREIVIQAAARQKYIDQSQSLNLMIPPDTKPKDVSDLLIEGWDLGVKTFYYQRSANPAQELSRKIMTCTSCEA